jgi:hypothetical protein
MRARVIALCLVASLVAAGAVPAVADSPNISLSAQVTPVEGTGPCPAQFTFSGTITATDWSPMALRQIQYKWIRSDGANAPVQTIAVAGPAGGTYAVSTTWTLGAQGTFWEALQVIYPQSVTSNHAEFTNHCGHGVIVPPRATPVPEDCIAYNPAILRIVDRGPFWQLTSGALDLQIFQTQGEALRGLAVARGHTQQCFIGRSNTEPDRYRYITEYWK